MLIEKMIVCGAILVATGVAIYVQPHAQAWWDRVAPTENETEENGEER